MRVAVTGHRPGGLPGGYDLQSPENVKLRVKLRDLLVELKPDEVASGMALGTDTLFAGACLGLGLPLHAFVPCLKQESLWRALDQAIYHKLIELAAEVHQVSDRPYRSRTDMDRRNQAMVEWLAEQPGSVLVAVLGSFSEWGGTTDCIRRAATNETTLRLVTIDPAIYKVRRLSRGWVVGPRGAILKLYTAGAVYLDNLDLDRQVTCREALVDTEGMDHELEVLGADVQWGVA